MTAATTPDLGALRGRQLELALRGDRAVALREASRALDLGVGLADFVFEVLAPVQTRIGLLWQDGRITPARERAATETAELLLTMAASRRTPTGDGANLVLCVADHEHHNLPARMVAELLRLEGHRVTFLGAARPGAGLAGLLRTLAPDALVLSCSLAMNLTALPALAAVAHDEGVPVLGGGRGFGGLAARARVLGLQAHAERVPDVAPALRDVPPIGAGPAADDDRVRQHAELVAARVALADDLTVATRRRGDRVLTRGLRDPRVLRADVVSLLRFLEAAVLCDEQIFTEYVDWLADRLRAVRARDALLPVLLGVVHDRLADDLPRAGRIVARALA